jgi:hypothetical protein
MRSIVEGWTAEYASTTLKGGPLPMLGIGES